MTLLIACLMIYQLDMSPWLYVLAIAIWLAETGFRLKQLQYLESKLR